MANLFSNQLKNPDEFHNFYIDICIRQRTVRLIGGFMCDNDEISALVKGFFRQQGGSLGPVITIKPNGLALVCKLPHLDWPTMKVSTYPLLDHHVAVDIESNELIIGIELNKSNTAIVFGMLYSVGAEDFDWVVGQIQFGYTAKIVKYGVME